VRVIQHKTCSQAGSAISQTCVPQLAEHYGKSLATISEKTPAKRWNLPALYYARLYSYVKFLVHNALMMNVNVGISQ